MRNKVAVTCGAHRARIGLRFQAFRLGSGPQQAWRVDAKTREPASMSRPASFVATRKPFRAHEDAGAKLRESIDYVNLLPSVNESLNESL